MRVLRFSIGAGLIVVSALLVVGAAAMTLGIAVGEVPGTPQSLGRMGIYVLLAVPCAYGGYRVLRSMAASRTLQRP